MSPFERAVVSIGERGRQAIVAAQGAAVGAGGNYAGGELDYERASSAQDLLCIAGSTAVELAMVAQLFDATADDFEFDASARRALRGTAAGVTRMLARALEVHARDTGYAKDVWTEYALAETELLITDDRDPLFDGGRDASAVGLTRLCSAGIFAALAALPADRMGVPEQLARALGASTALFMIADSADDGHADRLD